VVEDVEVVHRFLRRLHHFSTFELETFKLVRDGSFLRAFCNVAGSVVAGFLALMLAVLLVNALRRYRRRPSAAGYGQGFKSQMPITAKSQSPRRHQNRCAQSAAGRS
jgi:hypothetical protein